MHSPSLVAGPLELRPYLAPMKLTMNKGSSLDKAASSKGGRGADAGPGRSVAPQ
jgi:hypothetical protein